MNKDVEKKIAEIKSYFNCGEPVYSKYRLIEEFCLLVSRLKYRLTYGMYFRIKYFLQRLFRGYDDLDKWNAAWYIARKAIPVLKEMRNNFKGTSIKWHREDRFGNIIELSRDEVFSDDVPEAFTEEEWRSILDNIIFSFSFVLKQDDINDSQEFNEQQYNNDYKKYKRGLKLFSIYYMNLWD